MEVHVDCQNTTGSYTGSGSASMIYLNSDARIGSTISNSDSPSGAFLDGKIDQFVIWDRELNPIEISFLGDTNNPLAFEELRHLKSL